MTERFAGRTALITGAASGIGRAVTARLVAEGAHVFAVDVDGAGLEATAGLAPDGSVTTHVADLTDPATCRAAAANDIGSGAAMSVIRAGPSRSVTSIPRRVESASARYA